ncbi:MAG TPA: 2-succinyl-5-enolpyruvyl-6-hydroxy-3-cyclohexene-1-carboxylic-acid synthase [Streptosporangiaceae bacterium]|nr:2-succinyl-5-enolpyruvyl-6-hydroxy-3-cyclohexene-1-carboxylic-acid synthase [Streptosporangiaceae bacterium]
MNPSTAFGRTIVDELIRCGLREAVVTPGSRSAPLAMAIFDRSGQPGDGGRPRLRLHVRIDERSAGYLGLGLAKASGVPPVIVCTSGTAAANFHPAVVEADEAFVPLIVLTADRPPELRGNGANQAIDQVKLYGAAVRWFCEAGTPDTRPGMAAYWRSLACDAWAHATGAVGGLPGPVHVNVPLAEPLVPDDDPGWPEPLDGRKNGAAWTRFASRSVPPASGSGAHPLGGPGAYPAPQADLPDVARGVLICGDGTPDPDGLVAAAQRAGWPVLAEPSSGARNGPGALAAYPYLLATPEFVAVHQPDVVVTAGRPGLSREVTAFVREAAVHIVIAQGPGRWADGARTASLVLQAGDPAAGLPGGMAAGPAGGTTSAADGTAAGRAGGADGPAGGVDGPAGGAGGPGAGVDGPAGGADGPAGGADGPAAVARALRCGGRPRDAAWLASWLRADAAARDAADAVLDEMLEGDAGRSRGGLSEPRLARDLAAALPDGALLWAASSMPIRDLDQHMTPRAGLRVLASRGASGIDGLVSAAMGAALAHQRAGGGPAVALLGDLSFVHDHSGLVLGPDEPRPDLAIVVVNNDGGGIFSLLEQATFHEPFERVFGTPHRTDLAAAAAAVRVPYQRLERPGDLPDMLAACASAGGIRLIEVRTDRASGAVLRDRLRSVTTLAVASASPRPRAARQATRHAGPAVPPAAGARRPAG